MYEHLTYEVLLQKMIDCALSHNEQLDSREGSVLWLGQAPAAVELQNLYIALDNILKETFADTASRPYLILRAKERGLSPLPASAAVLQMKITPVSLKLPIQTRFSIGHLNYYVSEFLGEGTYSITCETVGEIGNDYAGPVIPIEYVEGLETSSITSLLVPGEDEEDTEAFRQRYFNSLNTQAFGGNCADYIEKVNAIPGVGGVKVYRAWNGGVKPHTLQPPEATADWISGLSGVSEDVKTWLDAVYKASHERLLTVGGTVKLVIIASNFTVPSSTLVEQVQEAIDPVQDTGEGVGLAPIGHVVRVEGVQEDTINISFSLTYQSGWAWEDMQSYVQNTISKYLSSLAEDWAEQEETLVVRISQLESRILAIQGVLDITNTKINGMAENYTLPVDHIPSLGNIQAE